MPLETETYANAPLALVAMEIRFPSEASGLELGTTQQRAFRNALGKQDWVIETHTQKQVEVEVGDRMSQTIRTTQTPRFLLRDRTISVTTAPQTLTVETTNYDGYAEFRDLLERVFHAAREIAEPDSFSRIGLRYIDEVRVGDDPRSDLNSWSTWVHEALLAPPVPDVGFEDVHAGPWTGMSQYRFPDDRALVFRYGPADGFAVNADGPLRRKTHAVAGPLFMLDFDSYWEPRGLPRFDPQEILQVCDLLHTPASSLFESFITDRLRNEVFRREVR